MEGGEQRQPVRRASIQAPAGRGRSENDVIQLRLQLRKGGSRLLSSFEEFLVRIFSQLQEADNEKNKLECALKKLEQQCTELLSSKEEIKVENTKPKRTNQELQRGLETKSHKLSQAQKQWQVLQEEASRLHEEKEISKFSVHVNNEFATCSNNPLNNMQILKEHEDKVKEKTMELQADMNKKSCCIRP